MSQPYLGEIKMFAGNFPPRGYAFCNGQTLAIASNTALFSILGTTYGGNGTTTFQLPNLQGRVPVGMGNGPGLTARILGETFGEENHQLTIAEMPPHNHALNAVSTVGNEPGPGSNLPSASDQRNSQYSHSTANTSMAAGAIALNGGNQSHNNLQPSLGMNFIIALVGIFPSRN